MELVQLNTIDEALIPTHGVDVVLVEVFSKTCGPCKMVKQQLTKIVENEELPCNVEVLTIDIADDQEYLVDEYGIRSVPHFLIFKNGEYQSDMGGAGAGKLQVYLDQVRTLAAQ